SISSSILGQSPSLNDPDLGNNPIAEEPVALADLIEQASEPFALGGSPYVFQPHSHPDPVFRVRFDDLSDKPKEVLQAWSNQPPPDKIEFLNAAGQAEAAI